MANRHESSEETIYVAVGKDAKECKSILLWALENSGGKRICILHVHQPAQYIPFMGGKAPASSLKESIVREYHETERQKMHEIMDEYLLICRQKGAPAHKLIAETGCVEKEIVQLVSRNGIRKLVMGAAAEKHYGRKMMDLKSNKAKYVRQHAPVSCHIQFICKGHLIFTREITETGQSNYLRSSRSVAQLGFNRDTDIPIPEVTEELSSPKSSFFTPEESFDQWDLPRSFKLRVVDETLTPWNEGNENGLEFSTLSSASASASGYSRSSSSMDVASSLLPPIIPSLISSPTLMSTCSSSSSSGAHSVVVEEVSLDNTLYEQLRQAMAEADKEALKRRKAERDMIAAIRWKEKEEFEKVKNQRDQLMEELRISQERETSLKCRIAELHIERDDALKEAQWLRRKQGEASGRHRLSDDQFFEFSLIEIEEATLWFDESLKIGEGGYGNIYKGLLRQTKVAIKMLKSHDSQGTSQFQMEVDVLSQLRHPNLVKLIGSCPEVFALIYEYLPNGSLEDRLSMRDNTPPLSWQTRIGIAIELCSVLVYLHSIKPHSIVHGDLKPSNILLDANFVCKLSDFGICRMLLPDASSSNNTTTTLFHITVPKGSFAFIDPEFLETGVLTLKSDVYSFGIILLQLLTGRQPFWISNEVKNALDARNLKTLLDPSAGDWPIALAQNLAKLALRCCDRNRENRPDLGSDVWKVLEPMRASRGSPIFIPAGS
ncbi:U-box domain-containing protein 33-like isoform X1 [Alnus glutinosa]|uniref:U-box domain-containing protein 33-like isoform X1 n=1 Tax=Alnus glutinosa TaxID=3517 RepID=UPI002D77E55D|nr:U-box domain-containing protein 33-like isoform X1 [Alnus glutinosa]